MNDGKGGLRMAGKEVMIVVVVVFSSISFTLGFFVGKNLRQEQSAATSAAPEMSLPQPAPVQPSADIAGQNEASADRAAAGEALPSPPAPPSSADAMNERTVPPGQEQAQKSAPAETQDPQPKAVSSDRRPQEEGTIYTVQVGALKNRGEAVSLKKRLARKGYKTFISVTGVKGGERLFKVRTGAFKDKTRAEDLSERLKSEEGLHTFVTARDE